MRAVRGTHELRGNANAIAFASKTAFENISNIQLLRDLGDIGVLAFERKRGSARHHSQSFNLSERIENLFADAVAKILLIFRLAHIDERQYRDRFFVGGGNNANRVRRLRRPAWWMIDPPPTESDDNQNNRADPNQ